MYETIRKSRAVYGCHFYGNEASRYGKENGYVDYRTFSEAFDAVMNNSIMSELEAAGFYFETVQDGSSDYQEEIDELREEADELRDKAQELGDQADAIEADAEQETDEAEAARLMEEAEKRREESEAAEKEADEKEERADDLEAEQEPPEIFQFFIVDDAGAVIIQEWTDDPLFYCSALDMYIWGVTHWGTSWDYVLTDIRINAGEEALK